MKLLSALIVFIICIKLIYISLTIWRIILKHQTKEGTDLYKNVVYWKDRVEFIFTALMAVLLIILFNPRNGKLLDITTEERILLFVFGWILLLTADWGLFIREANWSYLIYGN